MIARFAVWAGALLFTGCTTPQMRETAVTVSTAGPPVSAEQTGMTIFYRVPGTLGFFGAVDQQWSVLGREDRAAAAKAEEYAVRPCAPASPGASGRREVIETIAAKAADHRIVIVNESHTVTRHRDTIRELLGALRPLGYTVYAAETFQNREDRPDPVEETATLPYPDVNSGTYTFEPVFGRALREAKRQGYRLVAYEETKRQEAPRGSDRLARMVARESAQAQNLAAILATMGPNEKLVVHVGYNHASEAPMPPTGEPWMAARLKALTGLDPLTVSQTVCASDGGVPFLAELPSNQPPGLVDLVLSQPVARFDRSRPAWRRQAGDLAIELPAELRERSGPLIIEAFRADEPFEAIPMDRLYIEPEEDIPLLLPPGRYKIRAIVPPVPGR